MKRALLLLSLAGPALAVTIHLFSGAGAFRTEMDDGFPLFPETADQDEILTVASRETGGLQGGEINLPDLPFDTALELSNPLSDQQPISWEFESGRPFQNSYLLAQAITTGDGDNPPVIAGLSMARLEGGSSPLGGGGSSPLSGGGSSPGGDGSGGDPQADPPLLLDSDPPPIIPRVDPIIDTRTPVPEPGTFLLLVAGLGSLIWIGRRLEKPA